MTAAIVKRLLWKEYRVQRGLWLALLLISVGMQVLVFFMLSSPTNLGPPLFGTLIGLGMLPAGFYTMGCGCVTFASEREDDTHIRAVSMVYPPALTLLLKMLFGIVTTLAFVALSATGQLLRYDTAAPLTAVPSSEPGVYAFKTELSMAGRWQLSLGAKVQGETGTVQSKLILKALP